VRGFAHHCITGQPKLARFGGVVPILVDDMLSFCAKAHDSATGCPSCLSNPAGPSVIRAQRGSSS